MSEQGIEVGSTWQHRQTGLLTMVACVGERSVTLTRAVPPSPKDFPATVWPAEQFEADFRKPFTRPRA